MRFIRPLLLAFIFIALALSVSLAEGPITAEVDRSSLSTDDIVTLTVTVRKADTNAPQLSLPPLDRFAMAGSSSASQISIVNGDLSAEYIYRYRLQPLEGGELIIGPFSVNINGQSFTSEPIILQVEQGNFSGPSGLLPGQSGATPLELAGQDFFAEAEVDNLTPYVGQQVVYTFRFYQALNLLDEPRYTPPEFTGFWNEPLPEQSQYTLQIDNRVYRITELRAFLFPTKVGSVTIDPGQLTLPPSLRRDGLSLSSQPITLEVQPLPPGAPEDFKGAVGRFAIEAELSQTESRVNEPVTMLVTLDGQGNMKALPDPEWPEITGWRTFEGDTRTNTDIQNGLMIGRRIYQRLLVPEMAGMQTIPAISYSYFDPFNEEYRTISTDPINLSIAPGAEEAPIPAVVVAGDRDSIERIATDIRHIKTAPASFESASAPLSARWFYWLLWLVPLFLLGASFYWQRRQAFLQNNVALTRSGNAQKRARKSLTEAQKTNREPYEAGGQILRTYLSDKINKPVAGMTQTDLSQALQSRKLNAQQIKRVQNCLSLSDMGRFSPAGANPTQAGRFLSDVEKLIDELEQAFAAGDTPQ